MHARTMAVSLIMLAALLAAPVRAQGSLPQQPGDTPFRPGVLLVRFRPEVSGQAQGRLLSTQGLEVAGELEALDLVSVRVPPGEELRFAERLQAEAGVLYAEPDYVAKALVLPSDPALDEAYPGYQWSLPRVGAPAAWDVVKATPDILIAVVDSGIDLDHPDLVGQIWTNPGETPPGDGVDDDGNGCTDDVHGCHYQGTESLDVRYIDGDVQDDYGHGTHVGGIAAAATDNAVGIAGLAWGATLLPVKVLDENGQGYYSDVADGIIYAADQGARIINLSVGGSAASGPLCDAVKYAYEQGSLVVAAAGNQSTRVMYPAACEHALGVAATDASDHRALFSNYGPQVDLAAPGSAIYSTWPTIKNPSDPYRSLSGTSMASPHVAGLAALIWSRWPDLTHDQVATQIAQSVRDVEADGWDFYTGWGRIDAAAAVAARDPRPATDLWVEIQGPEFASAGQALTCTVTYGNRGWLPAADVAITTTLPVSITSSGQVTYSVPLLDASALVHSFPVTFTVAAGADPGARLVTTATITSTTSLFSTDDDADSVVSAIAHRLYLPQLLRP